MTHRQEFGRMVQAEMEKHGLFAQGWDYDYDTAKKRLGQCKFGPKLLTFSLPYVDINSIDVMVNTVRHEIAHAIAGSRAGHGPEWKRVARIIGAVPQRCNSDKRINSPAGPYMFRCKCKTYYLHRSTVLNTMRRCLTCGHTDLVVRNPQYA